MAVVQWAVEINSASKATTLAGVLSDTVQLMKPLMQLHVGKNVKGSFEMGCVCIHTGMQGSKYSTK